MILNQAPQLPHLAPSRFCTDTPVLLSLRVREIQNQENHKNNFKRKNMIMYNSMFLALTRAPMLAITLSTKYCM